MNLETDIQPGAMFKFVKAKNSAFTISMRGGAQGIFCALLQATREEATTIASRGFNDIATRVDFIEMPVGEPIMFLEGIHKHFPVFYCATCKILYNEKTFWIFFGDDDEFLTTFEPVEAEL